MLPPACFRNLPPRPPSSSDTSPEAGSPQRRAPAWGAADACSTPPVAILCQLPEFCNSHPFAGFHGVPEPHNVCVRLGRRLTWPPAYFVCGTVAARGRRVVGGSSVRPCAIVGVAVAIAGMGSRQAAADTLESVAQRAARGAACDRRERAAGAFRLSAEAERQRQRRRRVPEIGLANSRRTGGGQQHGRADVLRALFRYIQKNQVKTII
jgi:hypothetical protein